MLDRSDPGSSGRERVDGQHLHFFTGDNGLSVGQHGLLGKQNMFDHSIHVPLLAAGLDLPSGTEVSSEIYLQDIMATSLSLAGIETGFCGFQ